MRDTEAARGPLATKPSSDPTFSTRFVTHLNSEMTSTLNINSQHQQVQPSTSPSEQDTFTILDGGMGHLLRRMGVKVEGEVGTLQRFLGVALANVQNPELVVAAHEQYINAGAEVITTNSYSCTPACLSLANPEGVDWKAIIRASGECALKARGTQDVSIAGCIPPLNASYRPDLVRADAELLHQYGMICEAIGPYSDLFLCETMSSIREALAAAQACAAYNLEHNTELPIWVGFTLSDAADGSLRSGESVEDALGELLALDVKLEAVLFNCCTPDSVSAALHRLQSLNHPRIKDGSCRLGGYANAMMVNNGRGGDAYNAKLTPRGYLEQVEQWGAAIVGGCCGIFPEHIAALRRWRDARREQSKESSSSREARAAGEGGSVSGHLLRASQKTASKL